MRWLPSCVDGSLSWDDAVAQYSIDDYSKSNGGDNGWNAINTFVEAYDNALVQLNADEISGPGYFRLRHSHHQVHRGVPGARGRHHLSGPVAH